MDGPHEPWILGAIPSHDGVRFCVPSRHATRVELCLFDPHEPTREVARQDLSRRGGDMWGADVAGVGPGTLYGYRVHGEDQPSRGHRFDSNKLLVDPAARATSGPRQWHTSHQPGPVDSADFMPRGVVVSRSRDWKGDRSPRTPWSDTVLYEAHVKGLTALHPDVPAEDRGRYLGLASPAIIDHLQRLGVTALQLLPVQQSYDEPHLVRRGLTNYWGYAPLALFAPDARYASGSRGQQVDEFGEMVRRLHAAGIEVLLDVVFNHTAEGDDSGPLLSLRGLDNTSFYRLQPDDPSRGVDWTGCGNTLDLRLPLARRLVHDCLRSWVEELHVDGFRFDLGVTLDRAPGFLSELAEDPVLSQVKLIAEPWDLGPDGYRLGRFGRPWVEWNDTFRSAARRTWRGDAGQLPELATRLAGSSDVFSEARGPLAGINYVACHDGFTLADLTAFTRKRNHANGEDNRDGSDANHSHNWGEEGATDDAEVLRQRDQAIRNMIATVALAQGVPMLAHGDEAGRTQAGNNNAYCQDGPLTWTSWDHGARERALIRFTAACFAARRRFAGLRRDRFLTGAQDLTGDRDVVWIGPDGGELHGKNWASAPALGMHLGPLGDDPALLLLLNPSTDSVSFSVPDGSRWRHVLDSAGEQSPTDPLDTVVQGRSLLLLRGN